jgi:hypothetical protein
LDHCLWLNKDSSATRHSCFQENLFSDEPRLDSQGQIGRRLSADAQDWRGRLRNPRPDSARYGQALTGDALYFRDPISDRIAGRPSIDWDSARILRLCALFDIFDYGDCAIELLEDFEKRKTTALDFDLETVLNALTPEIRVGSDKSSILSYRKYRSMSEDIRRQMDKEQYSSLGNLD